MALAIRACADGRALQQQDVTHSRRTSPEGFRPTSESVLLPRNKVANSSETLVNHTQL